jgi:hypothetical protein
LTVTFASPASPKTKSLPRRGAGARPIGIFLLPALRGGGHKPGTHVNVLFPRRRLVRTGTLMYLDREYWIHSLTSEGGKATTTIASLSELVQAVTLELSRHPALPRSKSLRLTNEEQESGRIPSHTSQTPRSSAKGKKKINICESRCSSGRVQSRRRVYLNRSNQKPNNPASHLHA